MSGVYSQARVRCLTPDARPGSWQAPPHAAFDAMRDAIRMAHGKSMDGPCAEVWGQVTAEWRRLRDAGWQLQTEQDA